MASRGEKMLLATAALRTAVASAAANGDEQRAQVQLVPRVAGVATVPSWDQLARSQPSVECELLLNAASGAVFALDDRNLMSMPWRHVFAVRDGDDFVIYDENGLLIDEPSAGVKGGRQSAEELVAEFTADGTYYYRPGRARNAPALHRAHKSSSSAEELGGASGIEEHQSSAKMRKGGSSSSPKDQAMLGIAQLPDEAARAIGLDHEVLTVDADNASASNAVPSAAAASRAPPTFDATSISPTSVTISQGTCADSNSVVEESCAVDEPTMAVSSPTAMSCSPNNKTADEVADETKPEGVIASEEVPTAPQWKATAAADQEDAAAVRGIGAEQSAKDANLAEGETLCSLRKATGETFQGVLNKSRSAEATVTTSESTPSAGAGLLGVNAATEETEEDTVALNVDTLSHGASSVSDRVDSGAAFPAGTRIVVSQPSGEVISGMVASVGLLNLLVAADSGEWISVELPEQIGTVSLESSPPKGCKSVVGLTYTQNKSVAGMLFGKENEAAFGNSMNIYMAHVARPINRDSRLRELDNRLGMQSISFGDILVHVGGDEQPPAVAALVRIGYTAAHIKQSRKLLILLEMPASAPPYKLPSKDFLFFPASWSNWKHVNDGAAPSTTSATTSTTCALSSSELRTLDKAYKSAKDEQLIGMGSLTNAIKFAGTNKTPRQSSSKASDNESRSSKATSIATPAAKRKMTNESPALTRTPSTTTSEKTADGGKVRGGGGMWAQILADANANELSASRAPADVDMDWDTDVPSVFEVEQSSTRLTRTRSGKDPGPTRTSAHLKKTTSVSRTSSRPETHSALPCENMPTEYDRAACERQSTSVNDSANNWEQHQREVAMMPPPTPQPHQPKTSRHVDAITTKESSSLYLGQAHASPNQAAPAPPVLCDKMHEHSTSSHPPARPAPHQAPATQPTMGYPPPPYQPPYQPPHPYEYPPSVPHPHPYAQQTPWHASSWGHPSQEMHYGVHPHMQCAPLFPPSAYNTPWFPQPHTCQAPYQPPQQSTPPRVRAAARLERMRVELAEMKAHMAEEEYKLRFR